MKLATFNVNGINARLAALIDWLKSSGVDAVALQETKTVDEQFPEKALAEAGYDAFFTGQKSYNGVALLVRRGSFKNAVLTAKGIPNYPDTSARVIAVAFEELTGKKWTFIGAYFPNGKEVGCDKYLYKLDWIAALTHWIRSLTGKKKTSFWPATLTLPRPMPMSGIRKVGREKSLFPLLSAMPITVF